MEHSWSAERWEQIHFLGKKKKKLRCISTTNEHSVLWDTLKLIQGNPLFIAAYTVDIRTFTVTGSFYTLVPRLIIKVKIVFIVQPEQNFSPVA